MNTIMRKELSVATTEEIIKRCPAWLTHDGTPYALVCLPEQIIYIGDLHPRVQHQLRAREAQVRHGMGVPPKIVPAEEMAPKES